MSQNRLICPLCSTVGLSIESHDSQYRQFMCGNCDCQWWVGDGEMDYEKDSMYEPQSRRPLAWYHRHFLTDIKPSGKMLDVGCGQGELLVGAQRIGWEVSGIDVASRNIEFIKKQYGITALEATTPTAYASSHAHQFDCVTAFEVIEHLREPSAFLESVKSLLRPGGTLVLSTPNRHRFGGARESWDFPPNHWFRFSERSLRVLLERSGFIVQLVRRQRFTNDFFHIRGTLSFGLVRGRAVVGQQIPAWMRWGARVKRFVFDCITIPISFLLALCGVRYWDLYVVAKLQ